MTNCPNCGAPITSSQCEYCGTRFPNYHKTFSEVAADYARECRDVTKLYNEALRAMRAYSSGILTMNEARRMVGLDDI